MAWSPGACADVDREHIRRNEFGWLLDNDIAELEANGTLPPRFQGLAGGKMVRQMSRIEPSPRKKRKTHAAAVTDAEDASEFYSELALEDAGAAAGGAACDTLKQDLLLRWLTRILYDEVQEPAFAFSRGLREVIPAGLLEIYSAVELQAMLGGGPAVSNAELRDWKRHCEYGNGLSQHDERVEWFWTAVQDMTPAARAGVWRFATGGSQPPRRADGGCRAMDGKFNLVARGGDEAAVDDSALISAATCHKQLQLPRYSSADVTARQLARSVQEGLAASEDSDSFEATQRRLLAKVQEEMAKVPQGDPAVQSALRKIFPSSFVSWHGAATAAITGLGFRV
jgi:hypothetical protein